MTVAGFRAPIVILAGDTSRDVIRSEVGHVIRDAFVGFVGTIVSGGTDAGISALAAEIGVAEPGVRTIGYVPRGQRQLVDRRYHEVDLTDGDDFSLLEPLEAWADLVADGIEPAEVKLLGVGGGAISSIEYRLALLLGARVGVVAHTGRGAAALLSDSRWSGHPGLQVLSADPDQIRRFLRGDDPVTRA
jgi:hypothetical protein